MSSVVKLALGAAAGAAAFFLPSSGSASPPSELYQLSFHDEFDADSVDISKWRFRTDTKRLSTQRAENVGLREGKLALLQQRQADIAGRYWGGGIVSRPAFRYGYFEVKARTTTNIGWWAAFWMMRGDGSGANGLGRNFEIDAFEIPTRSPRQISSGVAMWGGKPGSTPVDSSVCSTSSAPAFDSSKDFHTYGADWKVGEVDFYVDGQRYCTVRYSPDLHRQDAINIWLTTIAWDNPVTVGGEPQLFDDLAYYQKDYYLTPGEPGYRESGQGWRDSPVAGFGLNPQRRTCAADGSASWTPQILAEGHYRVDAWVSGAPRSEAAIFKISHPVGTTVRKVPPQREAAWRTLGSFKLRKGTQATVTRASGGGCLEAGMVRFVRER